VAPSQLASYHAVVILTDHTSIDYQQIVAEARLVVDTRNATRAVRQHARTPVVRL